MHTLSLLCTSSDNYNVALSSFLVSASSNAARAVAMVRSIAQILDLCISHVLFWINEEYISSYGIENETEGNRGADGASS